MERVLNVAAYRFVALADLEGRRLHLEARARTLGLRGTILLAGEGINLFLAGAPDAVRGLLAELRAEPCFAGLEAKESWSDVIPFRRLRVRIRREIIRMDRPAIRPADGRARAVDAATLKRWLDRGTDDAGRPVLMLDTRNRFEVEQGRFSGALDLGLTRFGEFPAAVGAVREHLERHAVVSYCTGGIRCEKASLYLDELGLRDHWQLDGGILKYFDTVGDAHFEGRCTVFDERGALDGALLPPAAADAPPD